MKKSVLLSTLLIVLAIGTVACSSDSEPDFKDNSDTTEEQKSALMEWESDIELNTILSKYSQNTQRHVIFFPPTDCSFKLECKNYTDLKFTSTGIVGDWCSDEDCWLKGPWEDNDPEWIMDSHCYSSPYFHFEINDNVLSINLKGGTTERTPCHIIVRIQATEEYSTLLYLEQESERENYKF